MRLLIVGCGYVGAEVVRIAAPEVQVTVLTRSPERAKVLQESLGVQTIVGDWLNASSLRLLPATDWILVAVPHRSVGGWEVDTHRVGLANLIQSLPAGWGKLVYLSSTGVYGKDSTEAVNEDTPTSARRIGPKIAVAAEDWLKAELNPVQYVTLRLAGIYGPGRLPLIDKLKSGEPLAVPQQGFLNLVHVADIARMIDVVFRREMARPFYVFSDGTPVLRRDFYSEMARLCGIADPCFVEPDSSDARVRRATSKRIDPTRIVTETDFEFAFASFRDGLANIVS